MNRWPGGLDSSNEEGKACLRPRLPATCPAFLTSLARQARGGKLTDRSPTAVGTGVGWEVADETAAMESAETAR